MYGEILLWVIFGYLKGCFYVAPSNFGYPILEFLVNKYLMQFLKFLIYSNFNLVIGGMY